MSALDRIDDGRPGEHSKHLAFRLVPKQTESSRRKPSGFIYLRVVIYGLEIEVVLPIQAEQPVIPNIDEILKAAGTQVLEG